jgi:hypothetical protein
MAVPQTAQGFRDPELRFPASSRIYLNFVIEQTSSHFAT